MSSELQIKEVLKIWEKCRTFKRCFETYWQEIDVIDCRISNPFSVAKTKPI